MPVSGVKVVSWNVAKVPWGAVGELLSLVRTLFGSHIILNLQEVESWPSSDEADVSNWEWVHQRGGYVACLWLQTVASWVRGSGSIQTTRACGRIVQNCAVMLNVYAPDSSYGATPSHTMNS